MSGVAANWPSQKISAEAMTLVAKDLPHLKACRLLAQKLNFSKIDLMKIHTFDDNLGFRIIDQWFSREGERATGQVLYDALCASDLEAIGDERKGILLGLSSGAASATHSNTAGSGQVSSNKDGPATSCMSRAPNFDDEDMYYPMNRKPRGIACIISNKNFPATLSKRDGTDVDVEQLDTLWKEFGFLTRILHDCTSKQMCDELRKLALEDHSNYNCVIVCILTHGLGEKLYGSDGELVPSKELMQLFDGRSVHQSLVNKPRLFFVQACRTDNTPDTGATTSHGFPGNNTADGVSWPSPPADMFFAGSSAPGYVSWLNNKDGAWFIQGVVKIFLENAKDDHLSDLMIKVKHYVHQKFQQHGHVKQVPSTTDQLTRKLHFRPGFYK